ncbi:extradiol ring-cleavage dioxygenase [Cytobacillus suaedae]|nr:extradiol ring-cleavage dioxygenase [Cytobacillus suaedae]
MNPFVFSCITPHGGEIIPELSKSISIRMEKTRTSMWKLGEQMAQANPDTIVVLTPHGTRIDGQFSISSCERMIGEVEENGELFKMERPVDKEIAISIVNEAKTLHLPVGGINFGTSEGPFSCLPLDWGTIVPLRFMPTVPIVVITPSRYISYKEHIQLGEAIRNVASKSTKKIGLIASCDWSHTHDKTGPYGYNPASIELDQRVVEIIKSNKLEELADFDSKFIEEAKPDGIWQTLILAGAIPINERQVTFLSYEAPTYFGLLCAGYTQK